MRSKLILVALAATALMALFASAASAGRLRASETRIRVTFAELVLGTASGINDTCHVTLEGSFHSSTITKVERTLIGYITRVETGQCTSNTTVLRGRLPWHLTYESFASSLPNITSLRLLMRNAEFQVEVIGFRCLSGGINISATAARNTATGAITSLETNERVPLRSGGGFGCPDTEGILTGSGTVSVLGSTTPITITLI